MEMFRHGRGRGDRDKMETVIGEGSFLDGVLNSERTIRIDGRLEGKVDSEGDVIVGPTGVIEADIHGVNITVGGKVTGNIIAQDRLEMKTNAEVYGDVIYTTIVIEEGVTFEGRCRSHHQARQSIEEPTLGEEEDEYEQQEKGPGSGHRDSKQGGKGGSSGLGDLGFLADFRQKKGSGEEQ